VPIFRYNVLVAETILRTKLHIPASRSPLVARPRLIEQINNGTVITICLRICCGNGWIENSKPRFLNCIAGLLVGTNSMGIRPRPLTIGWPAEN
jgi:hypothetical protein